MHYQNAREIKIASKQILNSYPRWMRMARRSSLTLQSLVLDDMPKGSPNPHKLENSLINRLEAERKCIEVEEAWAILPEISRQILYHCFLSPNRLSNVQVSLELGYSLRSIEEKKSGSINRIRGKLSVWRNYS